MLQKEEVLLVCDPFFSFVEDSYIREENARLSFWYRTENAKITYYLHKRLESTTISVVMYFKTNILNEKVVIKASEKAAKILALLETHPRHRLLFVTHEKKVELGPLLLEQPFHYLFQQHAYDNTESYQARKNALFSTIQDVYESTKRSTPPASLSLFSLVVMGKEGEMVSSILQEMGVVESKKEGNGIYTLYTKGHSRDRFTMEAFCEGIRALGIPAWMASAISDTFPTYK